MQLAGHRGRRVAVDVADELHARALVLEQDGRRYAVVSSDLLWLERDHVGRIRAAVERLTGIPPGHVLVACTHTHSGPDTLDWYSFAPPVSDWWLTTLVHQIAGTVFRAAHRLQDCALLVGHGTIHTAVNRRHRRDGVVRLEPNPDGPVDRRLTVLSFAAPGGAPIARIVHAAMHPVVLGGDSLVVSGDWCGVLTTTLERETGGSWLFLNGAAGDNNPRVWTGGTYEQVGEVARVVADAALAAGRSAADQPPVALSAASAESLLEAKDHPYLTVAQRRRAARDGGMRVEAQVLKIGPVALAALAGECLAETGDRIRGFAADPASCLPVSYANDYVGYLPLPHIYEEGGYEPSATMLTRDGVLSYLEAVQRLLRLA